MRKLFILCIGIFFAQQAAATSQCTFKAEGDIHCADCDTLEEFAFYGASALYASRNHQQRSIQVTGNNGSQVHVEKGLAWNTANLTINLGRFGEWGVENVPYPNLTETQVTAYDINHKVTGTLPNDGKFANGALNAKCKQIEENEKEKEEQPNENAHDAAYLKWVVDNVVSPKLNPVVPNWDSIPQFSGYLMTYRATRVCTSSKGYLSCS